MEKEHTIRAVVFKNANAWVAQCLEYDIATQAASIDALLYELERIVVAHLIVADKEGLSDPFADIPKAPLRFWEMYRRAQSTLRTMPELPASSKQVPPQVEVAFPDAVAA